MHRGGHCGSILIDFMMPAPKCLESAWPPRLWKRVRRQVQNAILGSDRKENVLYIFESIVTISISWIISRIVIMLCMPRQGNSSRACFKSTKSGQPCCRLARSLWNYGHRRSNISLESFRARWCIDIAYVLARFRLFGFVPTGWFLIPFRIHRSPFVCVAWIESKFLVNVGMERK